jgi:hypothetical protein
MKKLNVFLAVIISGLMLSCQNESVEVDIQESTSKELSKSALSTLKFLKEKGYDGNKLKPSFELNGFIYDDYVFPFDYYENFLEISSQAQGKNQYSGRPVSYEESNNMSYYVESNFPEYYVNALEWARYYWSISSPNIEIRRTFNRNEADIICSSYLDRNDGAYARASLPLKGRKVGNFLRVNNRFVKADSSSRFKLALMIHELGHTLGYEHSDQNVGVYTIPNTEDPTFHTNNGCGSVMRSGIFVCNWDYNNVKSWSQSDINAIEWGFRYE